MTNPTAALASKDEEKSLAPSPKKGSDFMWRAIAAAAALVIGLMSFFFVANALAQPEFWSGTIQLIEDKCEAVLKLVATSAGGSAVIAALPGDATTPIAGKLADICGGFSLVLGILYMEKYLLTIFALVAFKFLVPVACIVVIVQALLPLSAEAKGTARVLAGKIAIFALALVIAIPAGMLFSGMIENTYGAFNVESEEVTATEEAEEPAAEEEEPEEVSNPLAAFANTVEKGFSSAVNKVEDSASAAIAQATKTINQLIERLVILLVTSCVIPILVFVVLVWLANTIFGLNIKAPHRKKQQEKAE